MNAPQANNADGPALLKALEDFLTRCALLPPGMPLVLALYAVMTHSYEVFDALPYLAVTSPVKGCGKTRVLELLSFVCNRAISTVGISPAALFRTIEESKPTLLVDESESLSGRTEKAEAVREISNAGYKRGQKVMRCEGRRGGKWKVEEFDVFSPKVYALIGKLPSTLADRCIEVRMQRARRRLTRYRRAQAGPEGCNLQDRVRAWTAGHKDEVKAWYLSHDADSLEGRNEELWLPLFAVCAVLSPERRAELETVARQCCGTKQADEADEIGICLLSDIRDLFEQWRSDRARTEDILQDLKDKKECLWARWSRGRGLDVRGLSALLKPFGIRSQNIRFDQYGVAKGYYRGSFLDAWECYLPSTTLSSRYTATEGINIERNEDLASATAGVCSGTENATIPSVNAGCSVVADEGPL